MLTGRAARPSTISPESESSRLAELFQRAATGDTRAFATVYALLAPRVWAMAEAVTCDHDRAEAAAVQAFEGMWYAAPSCPSEPEAATAWAMNIAVRQSVGAAGDPRRPALGPPATPDRRGQHVRQVLLALPEPQRDAVLLSCYGQLSLGALAFALELPKQDAAALLPEALIHVAGSGLVSKVP